jgi:hypothetical protein
MENDGGQDVMVNLRNMFVTINNKAKEVSGHFMDLLNDRSIASFCVRELANDWKQTAEDSLKSNLQFLEWNQRSKSKSNQVNRQYTITTISIIAEVLRNNVFGSKKESKTYNLLNLGSKKVELEKHDYSTSIDYIIEYEFDVEQSNIIRDLAKEHMVPCLSYLLLNPSVYKKIQEGYFSALKILEINVGKGIDGWLTYKSLLKEFKETNKLTQEPAILAEKEFNRIIDLEKGIENYRKNVFQQAYIRIWAQIADFLVADFEITPKVTAKALVSSFEKVVFDYRKNLFDKSQTYTNLVLYDRAGKPNVSVRGKQFWTEFIMSFFAEIKTLDEFVRILKSELGESISSQDLIKIKEIMMVWGIDSLKNYCAEFLDKLEKDFIANWRTKEFPKAFKDRLDRLLSEESPENLLEFNALLKEKANYSFSTSIDPLFDLLGVDKKKFSNFQNSLSFDDQI